MQPVPLNKYPHVETVGCPRPTSISLQQSGKMNAIGIDDLNLAASFQHGRLEGRTICYWDLKLREEAKVQALHFLPDSSISPPTLLASTGCCFFTDQTKEGGGLGIISSQSKALVKTPHRYPSLSVAELKGATFGSEAGKATLVFWDLFTRQPISTFGLDDQGRNLCSSVPSQSSHLVVTVQSGTYQTPNRIALWDSRQTTIVKSKQISGEDILSTAVIETSKGPRIVTRSVNSGTIDFRGIFDEVFGEMVKSYDSNFGTLTASTPIPQGSGLYAGYNLTFLSPSGSKLSTFTNDTTTSGPSIFNMRSSTVVTVRSYDFKTESQEVAPQATITFPAADGLSPDVGFARDHDMIIIQAADNGVEKKLHLYEV